MKDNIFIKVLNNNDNSTLYIKLSSIDIFRKNSDGWIFVINDISYHLHNSFIELYELKKENATISFELIEDDAARITKQLNSIM